MSCNLKKDFLNNNLFKQKKIDERSNLHDQNNESNPTAFPTHNLNHNHNNTSSNHYHQHTNGNHNEHVNTNTNNNNNDINNTNDEELEDLKRFERATTQQKFDVQQQPEQR